MDLLLPLVSSYHHKPTQPPLPPSIHTNPNDDRCFYSSAIHGFSQQSTDHSMDGSIDQNDSGMVTGGKGRGKRSRGGNRDVLTQIDENATRNNSNNNNNHHTTSRNYSSSSKRHRHDQDHASVQMVMSSSSHRHYADDEGTQNPFPDPPYRDRYLIPHVN